MYTGAGLLGVAGVVEWPGALTGAAVAWLTQPKPQDQQGTSNGSGRTTSGTRGTAAATQTKKSTAPAKEATARETAPIRSGAPAPGTLRGAEAAVRSGSNTAVDACCVSIALFTSYDVAVRVRTGFPRNATSPALRVPR